MHLAIRGDISIAFLVHYLQNNYTFTLSYARCESGFSLINAHAYFKPLPI